MENKPKILIVDDEQLICELLQEHLSRKGYDVSFSTSPRKAISMVKEFNPQVVLLDKLMPELSGIELLKTLRQSNQSIKAIMISADELDSITGEEIKSFGLSGYFVKPIPISYLDALIGKIVK